jgi:hypothetical protein
MSLYLDDIEACTKENIKEKDEKANDVHPGRTRRSN